jgi:hypothetical protein
MATQSRMLPEELVSNLAWLHDFASSASNVPLKTHAFARVVVSSTRPSVRGASPKLP